MAFHFDRDYPFTPGLQASNGDLLIHALCDAWRKMENPEVPEKFNKCEMPTSSEMLEETLPKQCIGESPEEFSEKLPQLSHEKSTQCSDADLSRQDHRSLPEKFNENLPQKVDENLIENLAKLHLRHESKTTQTRSKRNSRLESVVLDLQIKVLQFQLQFFEKMIKRDMDKKAKSIKSSCDEIISKDPNYSPSSFSDNFDDLDKFPVRLNVIQDSSKELPIIRKSDSTASEKETRQKTQMKRNFSKKDEQQPCSSQSLPIIQNKEKKSRYQTLVHVEKQPNSSRNLPAVQNGEKKTRNQSLSHVEKQPNSSRSIPTVQNGEKRARNQSLSHDSKKPASVEVPNKCDIPLNHLKTKLTVSKNGHHHMKFTDVPFILGTSTTPSHSLTANVQQIIGALKTHNRLCSASAVTNKENSKSSDKPHYSKVLRTLGKDFSKLTSEREKLEEQLLENQDSQDNKKLHEKYKDIKSLLDIKAKEIIDWHKRMKSETTLKSKYTVDSRPHSEPSLPTQRFLRKKSSVKNQT